MGLFKSLFKIVKHTNLMLALSQDDVNAQFQVGMMYLYGKDVARDYQKALDLFQKSAEQGHSDAQYYLGYMYLTGHEVTKDYQKALVWLQKSAEQGHSDALHEALKLY
jgi:TPR repeat protein